MRIQKSEEKKEREKKKAHPETILNSKINAIVDGFSHGKACKMQSSHDVFSSRGLDIKAQSDPKLLPSHDLTFPKKCNPETTSSFI